VDSSIHQAIGMCSGCGRAIRVATLFGTALLTEMFDISNDIEEGSSLVPWNGQKENMIDRYDVRLAKSTTH
jgi:hypothetical protein